MIDADLEEQSERFRAKLPSTIPVYKLRMYPNYTGPVVWIREGRREVQFMEWGLLPHTARDKNLKKKYSTFNARAESLKSSKLYFPPYFKNQRCLIPATSFFEWADRADGKVQIEVETDAKIMAIAGLWEVCRISSVDLFTFTMITTQPNQILASIHSRMPAVLPESNWEDWLNPEVPSEDLHSILKPYEGHTVFNSK